MRKGDAKPEAVVTKTAVLPLRAAARLIEQVLNQLDTVRERCECCGAPKWRNLEHARVHERLEDLPERLRVAADRLTTGKRK